MFPPLCSRLVNVYLLATVKWTMPILVFSAISSSLTAGVCSSLAMAYVRISNLITYRFLAVLTSPPKACRHFSFALRVANCTVQFGHTQNWKRHWFTLLKRSEVYNIWSIYCIAEILLCRLFLLHA